MARDNTSDIILDFVSSLSEDQKTSIICTFAGIVGAENINLISAEKNVIPSPEEVVECVAFYLGLEAKNLLSYSRSNDIVLARHIAIYILRDKLNLTLPAIGRVMGRDHSTVISAIDKSKSNGEFQSKLEYVIRHLRVFRKFEI